MSTSDFVYESGDAVEVGSHGETSYVFVSGEPLPNSGVSEFVFESGTGIGGASSYGDGIWAGISQDPNTIAELNSDLSVARSSEKSYVGDGVGGGGTLIWVNSRDFMNELDPSDLSTSRQINYPDGDGGSEGGGKNDVMWTAQPDGAAERAPSDASVIRSDGTGPSGNAIGGDTTTVWVGDTLDSSERTYSDISVVDTWPYGSTGIGGTGSLLLQRQESSEAVVEERDPNDKSLIQENDTGGDIIHGVGGS